MIKQIRDTGIYQKDNVLPPALCQEIINRFESDDRSWKGCTGEGYYPDVKDSVDLNLSKLPDWKDIDEQLFLSLGTILNEMRDLEDFFYLKLNDSGYHMKRYGKNQFYSWHMDCGPGDEARRSVVCMWYLNTVPAGGHTQFQRQGISVAPVQGSFILFPPYWTHMHQGAVVEDGSKYIITTWLSL